MQNKAHSLLILMTLLLASMATPTAYGSNPPSELLKRPNIVFIFSDDHAYQAISAYGSRLAKVAPTPNIDRIAKAGMRFDHSYVTNSICGPARAVIQTGKHSHLNGFVRNSNTFNADQQTFPKILQKHGYQTALIGKWHLRAAPQGFNYYDILLGQGVYYRPTFINQKRKATRATGYVSDIITQKSLQWLKTGRDKTKPFMIMIQHKAPHRKWMPGPKYLTLFDDVQIPEPPTLFDDYQNRGTAAKKQAMTIKKTMRMGYDLKVWENLKQAQGRRLKNGLLARMTPEEKRAWLKAYTPKNLAFISQKLTGKALVRWKYQRYMKDYLRCIRSVDDGVGNVLDYLKENGLDKNTIVIYSSDQGFYLGEHGWFDKRFMYKESFRSPLLIKYPGVTKPGSVNTDLVQNLDFAQTFLDIAGVPQPSDMQGASLLPLLQNKTPKSWRKSLYYHYYEFPGAHSVRRHEGISTKRYKLIHFYTLNEWELYDATNDPNDMNNLYEHPDYQATIKTLKAELIRLKKQYQVPPRKTRKK